MANRCSDTSFENKGLKRALQGLILGILILLIPFFIFSFGNSWNDDFEDYAVGLLSDNAKWSEQASTYYEVVDDADYIFLGNRGVKADNTTSGGKDIIFNPDEEISSGKKAFLYYQKPTYWTSSYFGNLYFYFKPVAGTDMGVGIKNERFEGANIFSINYSANVIDCETKEYLGYQGGMDWDSNTRIDKDTWVQFYYEADFDNKIIKVIPDVEGLNPSERCFWFNTDDQPATLQKLKLSISYNRQAFDRFKSEDICALGSCSACMTYETCIEAGCFWYYSVYLQQWYCVEPFEPEPEECGAFWKCQYCLTQETCELQFNCEWIEKFKGQGEKCYQIEPEIPPEQVGWEVPELEDCEELSGVEKWLCEIKNFIAGIFMPSQEALDNLYQTIMNFKARFPFNYIGALTSFFTDLKNSLAEEKDIPITILGQEGEVGFDFWEQETEIGGVGETFSNILIDFTSIIIFLGWFLWLISFIQRFWT